MVSIASGDPKSCLWRPGRVPELHLELQSVLDGALESTLAEEAGLKAQLGGPKLDFRRSWLDLGSPGGSIFVFFFEGLLLQLASSAENVTTY